MTPFPFAKASYHSLRLTEAMLAVVFLSDVTVDFNICQYAKRLIFAKKKT